MQSTDRQITTSPSVSSVRTSHSHHRLTIHMHPVAALVVYEYITTIDQEIFCIWTRPFTPTSLLLLSTRWVMLVNGFLPWILSESKQCEPSIYPQFTKAPPSLTHGFDRREARHVVYDSSEA